MKQLIFASTAMILSLFTVSCKPLPNMQSAVQQGGNQSAGLNLQSASAKNTLTVGEFLTRIANSQYDLVEANTGFFIDGRPITLSVDGCSRSYFQLKTYAPNPSGNSPELNANDYETWNQTAQQWNQSAFQTLDTALQNSSCAFKDGNLESTFPEFFAFDRYWSKAYDESSFLTDEEYEKLALSQPLLIDKAEFLKRMECLPGFSLKPQAFSPKVCMIDRFEGLVKN